MMLFLISVVTSFAAGALQTVTGFGSATVLMMVFPTFLSMTAAPALSSAICMILAASLLFQLRHAIRCELIILPALIYTLSSYAVIGVSVRLDMDVLSLVFGVFLIFLSIYFLFFGSNVKLENSLVSMTLCSMVSGVCAGLFSIGGPTMALYYLAAAKNQTEYRANLQCLFAITYAASLPARFLSGTFTPDLLPLVVAGGVGVLLGKQAGLICAKYIDAKRLQTCIYVYVGITGLITVVQQIAL